MPLYCFQSAAVCMADKGRSRDPRGPSPPPFNWCNFSCPIRISVAAFSFRYIAAKQLHLGKSHGLDGF